MSYEQRGHYVQMRHSTKTIGVPLCKSIFSKRTSNSFWRKLLSISCQMTVKKCDPTTHSLIYTICWKIIDVDAVFVYASKDSDMTNNSNYDD